MTALKKKFYAMSFDEFLTNLGLTEYEYGLGFLVYCEGRGVSVMLKCDPCDVFVNNYNPKILELQEANIFVSFVSDEYRKYLYSRE